MPREFGIQNSEFGISPIHPPHGGGGEENSGRVGEKFEIRNPKSEIPQLGTAGPSTQTVPGYLNPNFGPEG
jgi:hypothetical protein